MLLDTAAGGTMMVVDVEHETNIIDALASTDYQAHNDRKIQHKKGVMDRITWDAILAQNKILTQQVEGLTNKMSKLSQQ